MRRNLGPGNRPPFKVIEGGGEPPGGDMEARVARLEASIDHMKSDVSDLKSDARDLRDRMRAVEVKIDHLPSKGFIVVALLGVLTIIGALIGYADQIQSLLPGSSP